MKVQCHRVKLKEGSLSKIEEWSTRLNQEMIQVKETLIRENVLVESVFLEEAEDGYYLIYYMRAENFEKAREKAQTEPLPIDVYHGAVMKEVTCGGKELRCLLDVSMKLE